MPKRLSIWEYLKRADQALDMADLVVPFDANDRQDREVRALIKGARSLIERADATAYSYGRTH